MFDLSLTDVDMQPVTLQASGDCLPESPSLKTVIISKQLFPCSWYSVTFTKTFTSAVILANFLNIEQDPRPHERHQLDINYLVSYA